MKNKVNIKFNKNIIRIKTKNLDLLSDGRDNSFIILNNAQESIEFTRDNLTELRYILTKFNTLLVKKKYEEDNIK
jgi:hypothetical protein